jgi:crotonobetainyl-CoA:carnitine CoA-transferase CaiB-like acyl-CoA transferase
MGAPPLEGVRVVEAASFVSGPFAGQMLADLGAEVIKVEAPPHGDTFRRFNRPPPPYSPLFANCNRGKGSILADLKNPAQRDALLKLIAESDVWLTNWRPGVADRLGLGDEVLVRCNPRLIRVYLSGHGERGPRAAAPAFDIIVQATSGLSNALSPGEAPALVPGFPIDKLTAAMTTQAVVAALYARERRGEGERIDVSMLASAAYIDFLELFANRTFVDDQPAEARNMQAIGLRPLQAKDGWITISPVSGTAIRNLCEVAGHPEWSDELRALGDQTTLARELFARLEPVLPTRTVNEWLELFVAKDVPSARCLTIDEHLDDPQTEVEDIYRIEDWDGAGHVRTVRYPARFASAGRLGAPGPAPTPGQDNERYLPGVPHPG